MDEIARVSMTLQRRKRDLRRLLEQPEITPYILAHVRMSNVYDCTWSLKMAINKAKGKETKKAEFKGFFNFEMTQEMKDECRQWISSDENIGIELENALASGYKFTLSKDVRNDGYQATMQSNDPSDVNAGLCMSAFGKHWYQACGVVLFKHVVLLQKKWEDTKPKIADDDIG